MAMLVIHGVSEYDINKLNEYLETAKTYNDDKLREQAKKEFAYIKQHNRHLESRIVFALGRYRVRTP